MGHFVGYSINSKAYRVFNKSTQHVEENFHVEFDENKINNAKAPEWYFNIDMLTQSMNYVPVIAGTDTNNCAGTKANDFVSRPDQEIVFIDKWKLGSTPKPGVENKNSQKGDAGNKEDVVETSNVEKVVNVESPKVEEKQTMYKSMMIV